MKPDLPPAPFGPDDPVAVATDRCLLCRAPSTVLGVFVPGTPQSWGAPAGKDRLVCYGLCSPCFAREDVLDVVEGMILEALLGSAA